MAAYWAPKGAASEFEDVNDVWLWSFLSYVEVEMCIADRHMAGYDYPAGEKADRRGVPLVSMTFEWQNTAPYMGAMRFRA
ncbi:hypothetical protein [Luteibacter rhizovicinus]|uniref:hypothetical protein n=1 Tax=Luteibacter rhizovicinus TaxID=242606 RepID=UPI001046168F|nr:hypothetical protein [Luteibacter rhizovicinus]